MDQDGVFSHRGAIVIDMIFHALRFARDACAFSRERTSALVSVLKRNHEDAISGRLTATASFALFKALLLTHSVQRPPFSTGIFSLPDVEKITDYTLNTYYRHYRLYQHAFASNMSLSLSTRADVPSPPPVPPALAMAVDEEEWERRRVERSHVEAERAREEEERRLKAEEEAKEAEIRAAYEAAIPDEITQKVESAVVSRLEQLQEEMRREFEAQQRDLMAKLEALEGGGKKTAAAAGGGGGVS
eukprot:jgi/Chlat1/1955/Chrsp157S02265